MTFAVVRIAENRERIIGTIWADGESEAQQVAASLSPASGESQSEHLRVRRSEEREIPLRLMN